MSKVDRQIAVGGPVVACGPSLTGGGWPEVIDLPKMAEVLVEMARRLRVFVARSATISAADLQGVFSR